MVYATKIKVRYAETDQMGVVYYANYLVWFEVGRNHLFETMGFSYSNLERQDVILPVIESHCNYKISARYDDLIVVKTRITEISAVKIRFDYEIIRDNDGALLANGFTVHAFVDKKGKPIVIKKRIPFIWQLVESMG
jgi:acyl-CoA thioester hydrolase